MGSAAGCSFGLERPTLGLRRADALDWFQTAEGKQLKGQSCKASSEGRGLEVASSTTRSVTSPVLGWGEVGREQESLCASPLNSTV